MRRQNAPMLLKIQETNLIKRTFFSKSRICDAKFLQNLKSFWRSSQNYFVLALVCSSHTIQLAIFLNVSGG
jgi:hypothetical protein